jgi:AbrB family looped-hinge helix DNA binding protein
MIANLDKYGRILIPKKVREQLNISTETKLNIDEDGNRIIIERMNDESPIIEKEGVKVFTGKLKGDFEEALENDRTQRMKKLLGQD